MGTDAFTSSDRHKIYFELHVEGVPEDHPVLTLRETTNHTVCAD